MRLPLWQFLRYNSPRNIRHANQRSEYTCHVYRNINYDGNSRDVWATILSKTDGFVSQMHSNGRHQARQPLWVTRVYHPIANKGFERR